MREVHTTPLFTVFTGTYNRGALLHRVYDSLLAQTIRDFEWIVVDDGSTDDTRERISSMVNEDRIRIRYFYKPNGGVHTAHNLAVRHATGKFFMRCDSDDEFLPDSMATFLRVWHSIPPNAVSEYSGVSCLCQDELARIVGDCYPAEIWDSDWQTLSGLKGEKWGVHLTSVLRKFPYPEFEGERHVPEGLVWARLHAHYTTRCVNKPLRIYHSSPDQLTKKIGSVRYRCANAYRLYYGEQLASSLRPARALKTACNYVRVSRGTRLPWRSIISESPRRVLTALVAPVGSALYRIDQLRGFTGRSV